MDDGDGKRSRRDRMMGKLFGNSAMHRERRMTDQETASDISSFLGHSADKLQVTHPVPPPPPINRSAPPPGGPPALALDTSKVSRYPQALDVDSAPKQTWTYRARSHSPPQPRKAKKKPGLVVRFTDSYPEVIGEGGDECETAVAEIGRRKRSKSAPAAPPSLPARPGQDQGKRAGGIQLSRPNDDADFVPGPIRRTQTGFSSISDLDAEETPAPPPMPAPPKPRAVAAGEAAPSRFLGVNSRKDENRRSFIEIHQQEQRQAEGMAMRVSSLPDPDDSNSSPEPIRETTPSRRAVPQVTMREPAEPPPSSRPPLPVQYSPLNATSLPVRGQSLQAPFQPSEESSPIIPESRSPLRGDPKMEIPSPFSNDPVAIRRPEPVEPRADGNNPESPSSTYSSSIYSASATPATQNSNFRGMPPTSPERSGQTLNDIVKAAGDEALDIFLDHTKHLYELFRLYSEQSRPLDTCQPLDMCRAAIWWFLKGRTALESAVRNRSIEQDETKALIARYQAYTDLSKSYWLAEQALPDTASGTYSPVSAEIGEVRQALVYNLRKLCVSMKRNDFLPPEEPFLPQTMDKSIWIDYPSLSQDIVSLLNGNWGSVLSASQEPSRSVDLLEALPIGDTPKNFTYGRVSADVYLMEQGNKSSQTYFPCVLSVLRPLTDSDIVFSIASQNGTVTLPIQGSKKNGATWQDVRWRKDVNSLEIKLPRGFLLAAQFSQQDFKMLWGMYDFSSKVQSYLYPRKDEVPAYQVSLRGFHYFDANPQGRAFPKEPVGQCEMALFEKVQKEGSPHGPRTFHWGFRVAVVTGPRTRTLSGISNLFTPQLPIQFAFLRGDQRAPLLQLEFNDGKDKGRMVLSFNEDHEREKLLKLLNGTYIHPDEEVVAELPLEGMNMSEGYEDPKQGYQAIQRLPWQRARVINDRYAGDEPPTVLAEKLRVEVESIDKKGVGVVSCISDRINVAPGELKLRLGTKNIMTLQVSRLPQTDMTISVSENFAPRETAREFMALQSSTCRTSTVRTYRFPSFKDLHAFQAAITGYRVLFDGIASTLNIARRMMVVPIQKKWHAGTTRVQVVQQDKTIQLLAFFEDWHHGHCMGFVLKGTDSYESFSRDGKAGLKLLAAKFPLPKRPAEGQALTNDMAFVSLDLPDYPGENDDITILFEDPGERDQLCAVLPAPVKGSRLSKIM